MIFAGPDLVSVCHARRIIISFRDVGAQRQTKAEISGLVLTSRSDQLDFGHDFGAVIPVKRVEIDNQNGGSIPLTRFSSLDVGRSTLTLGILLPHTDSRRLTQTPYREADVNERATYRPPKSLRNDLKKRPGRVAAFSGKPGTCCANGHCSPPWTWQATVGTLSAGKSMS